MHGQLRFGPPPLPPDAGRLFESFTDGVVQRAPDEQFVLRGYSWQSEDEVYDLAESHYADRHAPEDSSARSTVRTWKDSAADGDGVLLQVATHLLDVIGVDDRFDDEFSTSAPARLADELRTVSWEPLGVLVDGHAAECSVATFGPLRVARFRFGGSEITAVGSSAFVAGPYEVAVEPSI